MYKSDFTFTCDFIRDLNAKSLASIFTTLAYAACTYCIVNPDHPVLLQTGCHEHNLCPSPWYWTVTQTRHPMHCSQTKRSDKQLPRNFSSAIFHSFNLVVVVNWQLPTCRKSLTFLCCDWSTQIHTQKKRAPLKSETFSQLQRGCHFEQSTELQTHPQYLYIFNPLSWLKKQQWFQGAHVPTVHACYDACACARVRVITLQSLQATSGIFT